MNVKLYVVYLQDWSSSEARWPVSSLVGNDSLAKYKKGNSKMEGNNNINSSGYSNSRKLM